MKNTAKIGLIDIPDIENEIIVHLPLKSFYSYLSANKACNLYLTNHPIYKLARAHRLLNKQINMRSIALSNNINAIKWYINNHKSALVNGKLLRDIFSTCDYNISLCIYNKYKHISVLDDDNYLIDLFSDLIRAGKVEILELLYNEYIGKEASIGLRGESCTTEYLDVLGRNINNHDEIMGLYNKYGFPFGFTFKAICISNLESVRWIAEHGPLWIFPFVNKNNNYARFVGWVLKSKYGIRMMPTSGELNDNHPAKVPPFDNKVAFYNHKYAYNAGSDSMHDYDYYVQRECFEDYKLYDANDFFKLIMSYINLGMKFDDIIKIKYVRKN